MSATAPNDFHVFSPLLLTYLLRRRGWDVIYLGADVPADELESTIALVKPGLVIISAQLLHTAANLNDLARSLTNQEAALAFGGLIFNHNPSMRRVIPGHFLGQTIEEAVQNAVVLLSTPSSPTPVSAPDKKCQFMLNHFMENRSLIEAHVWQMMLSANRDTVVLTAVNEVIALTIQAALRLGDISLLQDDIDWFTYLLMGYRLEGTWIQDFIAAYHQALQLYLGEPGKPLSDWFSKLHTKME